MTSSEDSAWHQRRELSPIERLTMVEVICERLQREHDDAVRPTMHDLRTTLTNLAPRLERLEVKSSEPRSPPPDLPALNGVLLLLAAALIGRDPEALLRALASVLGAR